MYGHIAKFGHTTVLSDTLSYDTISAAPTLSRATSDPAAMNENDVEVCPSSALVDGGLAYKLAARYRGNPVGVFFVRYKGKALGYVNRCPHMGAELDWEGSVFTRAGDQLMCARHGATFAPDTGVCTGGPCKPSRLVPLNVSEVRRDGQQIVMWHPEANIAPLG